MNPINYIRLINTPKVGVKNFWRLLEKFNDFDAIFDFLKEKKFEIKSEEYAQSIIEKTKKYGANIVFAYEENYPQKLKYLDNPPPILYYKGDFTLAQKKAIAIVGARNASVINQRMAYGLAKNLSDFVIISGFAKGIDSSAHQGSIETGTIAVLANGLDVIYPPENKKLYAQMLEKGLFISEFHLGIHPTTYTFPVRNRVIAALSDAVIIVEAAFKSGTMITAECAMNLAKPIFVVPGHPSDPRSRGGNYLIKNGARLIDNAQDVIEGLAADCHPRVCPEDPVDSVLDPRDKPEDDALDQQILSLLSTTPIYLDEIIVKLNTNPTIIIKTLSELEIDGRILKDDTGRILLNLNKSPCQKNS